MFISEPLELRALFSEVTVTDGGGLIRVVGDAQANAIFITQVKGGHLKISGAQGTTVNGQVAYLTASVTQYVTIAMGSGDDYVNLSDLTMPYSVKVDGGKGDDTIEFHNSTFGATDVYPDSGDDTTAVLNVTQKKWLQIFAGDGKDITGLRSVRADQGFSINDSGTGGNTALNDVTSTADSWITTGNGNDTLAIKNSAFSAFSAKLRGGSDTAVVRGTTFNTYSPIDGGDGTNDIDREVVVTSDFTNGPSGWNPGLWINQFVFPNQTIEQQTQNNDYQYGVQAIPGTTITKPALYSFDTSNDDLSARYFYLQKAIGLTDGISPGQRYVVKITLNFVRKNDDGSFLLAATGIQPHGILSSDGVNYVWSLEQSPTSNQYQKFAQAGVDGPEPTEVGNNYLYGNVTTTTASSITTDSSGFIYAVVGDSSMVSNSVPAFPTYYVSATVTATPVK